MSVYAAAEKIAAIVQEYPDVDHGQALAIALLVKGLVKVQPIPKPAFTPPKPPEVPAKPEVPTTVVSTNP